jgi:oligopeptide/dipeptide ABC transporter ATP-binding protein
METGSVADIFYRPTHPYTHALLASIPRLDQPRGQPLTPIPGRPPDLVNPAPGCPFAPRCPHVLPVCRAQMPPLEAVATPGHRVACWNPVKETAA